MWQFLGGVGFLGVVVGLVLIVLGLIKNVDKKKKQRNFAILIISFLLIVSSANISANESSSHMKSTGNEDTSIPPKSSSAEKDTASDATPKQSLLYKGHDTVIKTTGIDNSDIAFYFENNSDLNLSFDIHSYAVNGIMAEEDRFVMSTDVVSGKKASNTLSISKSWLRENGIS